MENNIERKHRRMSRLAIASFIIGAFVPALYFIAYFDPFDIFSYPFIILPLDGNIAALLVWLIFPVLGFVLGAKAKGQCLRHALAGGGWATAGFALSFITGITFMFVNDMESRISRHGSGFYFAKNLRQLAVAVQIYAHDNQGILPLQISDLDPLVQSKLHCPSNNGQSSTGYGYNQVVAGKTLNSVANPIHNSSLRIATAAIRTRADIDDDRHEKGQGRGLYWHIGPWPRVFVASYLDGSTRVFKSGAEVSLMP